MSIAEFASLAASASDLSSGKIMQLDLQDLPGFECRPGSNMIWLTGLADMAPEFDEENWIWQLTAESWSEISDRLMPFAEASARGRYQWLSDVEGGPKVLVSFSEGGS